VEFLYSAAANAETVAGNPITVFTMACRCDGEVSQWSIDLPDTRRMIAALLVSLASNDDKFAQRLLDDRFPAK
jgi:hypothetical protein